MPTSQSGRAFTAFYALCGVAVIGNLVSYFGEKVAEKSQASMKEAADKNDNKFVEMLTRKNTERQLAQVDATQVDSTQVNGATKKETTDLTPQDSMTYKSFLRENWVFLPLLVVFAVGSWAEIMNDQGGTAIDVLYYTVVTLTTVGYGDFSPDDQLMRGLATLLIPLSTFAMATLIGRFAEFQLHKRDVRQQAKKWEKGFNKEDLLKMDEDGDGQVSKREFVYFMLISSEKATKAYLDRLEALFDELDDDGSGYLDENDFITQIERSNEKLKRFIPDKPESTRSLLVESDSVRQLVENDNPRQLVERRSFSSVSDPHSVL